MFEPIDKELRYFLPSKIQIPDPDPGVKKHRIPDLDRQH